MKKFVLFLFASIVVVLFTGMQTQAASIVKAGEDKFVYKINPDFEWLSHEYFVVANGLFSLFEIIIPDDRLIMLYDNVTNVEGQNFGAGGGATTCSGKACYSWICSNRGDIRTCNIMTADIPISLTDFKSAQKSLSMTIKETRSLRKGASTIMQAAVDMLKGPEYSTGKQKGYQEDREMRNDKSMGGKQETNLNAKFFNFLSMSLNPDVITWGGLGGYYKRNASALTLLYRAYHEDYLEALINAFLLSKSTTPDDIEFTKDNDHLNLAKYIYGRLINHMNNHEAALNDEDRKQIWGRALLAVALYSDPKVAHLKEKAFQVMRDDYEQYKKLLSHTTADIAKENKDIAAKKYVADIKLSEDTQLTNEKTKDVYLASMHTKLSNEQKALFEKAMESGDPLMQRRFVKAEIVKGKLLPIAGISTLIVGIVIAGFFVKRRKSRQKKEQ